MADNSKFLQAQPFTLYGAGASLGDTSVVLTRLVAIDGTTLITMTNFGTKGFMTLEPNAGTQEEQISFTDISQNANGTATLTGVSTVLFVDPYTETSGLAKDHAGGTQAIATNTAGFYARFCAKDNDETITGTYTFTTATRPLLTADTDTAVNAALVTFGQLARASFSGTVDASTVQKGIVEIATGAELAAGTGTGGTGAILVPAGSSFTNTSAGAGDVNKIPVLAADGTIAQGFLNSARTIGAVYSATAANMQITTDGSSSNDAVRFSLERTDINLFGVNMTSGEAITAGQWVYLKAADSKVWLCDADADESTYSVMGIAITTVAAADLTVRVARPGAVVTGLSGLTAGSYYFLSGTTGAIAATPHATRPAKVAQALTTTSLRVIEPKFTRRGTTTVSSVASTTVTTGFYPVAVRVRAGTGATAATAGISVGDDTNNCVRSTNQALTATYLTNKAWSVLSDAVVQGDGTIDTKTQTGFNFNNATAANDVILQWEAESF